MRRLEPSEESELESSKESDAAKVPDVKVQRKSSRADKLQSVEPTSSEHPDLDQEREELEPSSAKLQEEREAASMSGLKLKRRVKHHCWKSPNQLACSNG